MIAYPSLADQTSLRTAYGRNTMMRRLAVAHVRELRAAGWSYREIGRHFRYPDAPEWEIRTSVALRGSPERCLDSITTRVSEAPDQHAFLRALDLLNAGLVFFDLGERLVVANETLKQMLAGGCEATQLRLEINHFVHSIATLVHARRMELSQQVQQLAARELRTESGAFTLRGSFVGLGLFGTGATLLITVERAATSQPCDDTLRERFNLSRKECSVAIMLAEGKSNAEIAEALFMSPHTARTHTKRILDKLGARSRAEVAAKLQRR